MELLERDRELAMLDEIRAALSDAGGRLVALSGEAGLGKSALLRAFLDANGRETRVLWGACEALSTPEPLGPLYDIAPELDGDFRAQLTQSAPRLALFRAFLDALGAEPAVVVFEDVHWADEATLDLLRYLGRRLRDVPVMLVATYRDDEPAGELALRRALADVPREVQTRIRLKPLSEAAVAVLAERAGRDPDGLYAATAGNPFFVSEVLASESSDIPATVRDAVLARASRLSEDARAAIETLAASPGPVERGLAEAVTPGSETALDACIAAGLMTEADDGFAFRHELARRAVEDALPPAQRRAAHKAFFDMLSAREDAALSRIVYHAVRAEDTEGVVTYAPRAAREAAQVGAHRESAAHFGAALQHADAFPETERAGLYEDHSYECHLVGDIAAAIASAEKALTLRETRGDPLRVGDTMRWLSRINWLAARCMESAYYCQEAVAVLEPHPPDRELVMAYGNRALHFMLTARMPEALEQAGRAIAVANDIGADDIMADALLTLGTTRCLTGDTRGGAELEETLRAAERLQIEDLAARAYANLAMLAVMDRDLDAAQAWLDAGIRYAEERDLITWLDYMRGWSAQLYLAAGRYDLAAQFATRVLTKDHASPHIRFPAASALARIRARRGDPQAADLLKEITGVAQTSGEISHVAPAFIAAAEAAWLDGDDDAAREHATAAYEQAAQYGHPFTVAEAAYWLWQAGGDPPDVPDGPYTLQMAGDWAGAAAAWSGLGCPYERALALADGDADAQAESLAALKDLGANATAQRVARRLRDQGVRGVPTGPRAETRANPAGLTRRQLDVVRLIAEGLSNAEIAGRLYISAKTVDHHVSAILGKLGVANRGEAAAWAHRTGLAGKDREPAGEK